MQFHSDFNYENGLFSTILFSYNEKTGLLTIGRREGDYQGMLQKRTFEITRFTSGQPRPLDFYSEPDQIVRYEGKEIIVEIIVCFSKRIIENCFSWLL